MNKELNFLIEWACKSSLRVFVTLFVGGWIVRMLAVFPFWLLGVLSMSLEQAALTYAVSSLVMALAFTALYMVKS